jgi:hypothetical protein
MISVYELTHPNPFTKMSERANLNQNGKYHKIIEEGGLQKLTRCYIFPHP